ncbi:Beta-glucanase-like protein [Hapsidospora chrysogenum ATCC 11550]|uniref:Beta-glucanase-like protein n=1 Tax=Hapsidospora chrysogenum (strain ATCC 11550 / CBS 779.69 / DSM 880 / IAM 14645 / JCM 23072 / IMI 49137) TaxID=857340 RepID=A0A086TFU9_HAPC1|nr:Beta-glucanase-like protein [Hapsidospora chrysogenum ATCC 11550]
MTLARTLAAALFGLGFATATPVASTPVLKRSPPPPHENGKYILEDRQAEFDNHISWDFQSGSLPHGLSRSQYPVGQTHRYAPENVVVRDGYLELLVPGGQSQPISCGEVVTDERNILYASVRTVAILTETPGVCNGMFFFESDNQETDIEWLSDPESISNGGTRKLWLTNQDTDGNGKTYLAIDPPSDPTSTEHEYRIDWTEGLVRWFVDGQQVWETTDDVPSVPGPWVFNNWSNGDKGWSAGPPAQDAVFKIQSIEMYYNTV